MANLRRFFASLLSYFSIRKVVKDSCQTKYPIVLVHGIMYRDDMVFSSWGRVPDYLRRGGARVFLSNIDSWASCKDNAQHLKDRVEEVLAETKEGKVNIIAHSKGGIDARYMTSKLGMADKVASLTTVCTPHRGSCIADIIRYRILPRKDNSLYSIVDFFGKIMGDRSPDSSRSTEELTKEFMQKFNEDVPDMEGVYYQSYGSQMYHEWNDPVFMLTFKEVKDTDGDNDGVVCVESCKWGNFKGIVKGNVKEIGISHLQMTGSVADTISGVNIPMLYVSWVGELKHKGF